MLEIRSRKGSGDDVIAQRGIKTGHIFCRFRHRGEVTFVQRLLLAVEYKPEPARLEAARRAALQRELAVLASYVQGEGRCLGRATPRHLHRQRPAAGEACQRKQVVGDRTRLPLTFVADFNLRILDGQERGNVLDAAEHRTGKIECVTAVDRHKRGSICSLLFAASSR